MIQVEIDQIDGLNAGPPPRFQPVYVLVAGGIAVGKSHVVRANIKTIPILDVDSYMDRFGYSDYSRNGYQFQSAMDAITLDIGDLKRRGESMVAMGTCGNFEFARFRLEESVGLGYQTVLLHVTASLDQARKQNEERRRMGDRAVDQVDLDLIEHSIRDSQNTVRRLLQHPCTDLISYFCHFSNVRVDQDMIGEGLHV